MKINPKLVLLLFSVFMIPFASAVTMSSLSVSRSPTQGPVPLSVTFTASFTGGTPVFNYTWNFGDGTISSSVTGSRSVSVSHVYSSAGMFNTSVVIRDSSPTPQTISGITTVTVTCTTDAQCASVQTTVGAYKVSASCINNQCVTTSFCSTSVQCSPATPSGPNGVCCGTITSGYFPPSTTTVCNSTSDLGPQPIYEHLEGTFGFSGCSYTGATWQPGACSSTICCQEHIIDYTDPIGSCVDPDLSTSLPVGGACANSTFKWAAGKLFEKGTPNCAGDDPNEFYVAGYSKAGATLASTTKDSAAVCDNKDANNVNITNECEFNGVCMNTSTVTGDSDNTCDGIDNNCNGYVDENAGPTCGCYYKLDSDVVKTNETFDSIDNDCNTKIDDFYSSNGTLLTPGTSCTAGQSTLCSNQEGVCKGSRAVCNFGYIPDCGATEYGPGYQATETSCDGLDNNCDGQIDEGCQNTNLLYFNGEYFGCNLPAYVAPTSLWYKLTLKLNFGYASFPPPQSAISNEAGVCQNKGSFFCDSIAVPPAWKNAFQFSPTKPVDSAKTNPTSWPDTHINTTYVLQQNINIGTLNASACCPGSFCFDGTTCVDSLNYTSDPKKPPIFMTYGETGYRCSAQGTWAVVSLKQDFNRNDSGYCTDPNECYAEGKCYSDGQWALFGPASNRVDRMCISGSWTTRTKYIAFALLQYVKDNNIPEYALYCDIRANALGETIQPDFAVSAARKFNDYFFNSVFCSAGRCANNFCVLQFGTTAIIGTSLNRLINDTSYPVYEAFGFNISKDKVADLNTGNEITKIFESDESGVLSYSSTKQIIFYSADKNVAPFNPTAFEILFDTLTSPIASIVNFIKSLIQTTYAFTDTLDKIADFDKVYFAQSSGKAIVGIQETKYDSQRNSLQTFVSLNYTGFDTTFKTNACDAVFARLPSAVCNVTDSVYIFDSSGTPNTYTNVWPDLTAKTRIP